MAGPTNLQQLVALLFLRQQQQQQQQQQQPEEEHVEPNEEDADVELESDEESLPIIQCDDTGSAVNSSPSTWHEQLSVMGNEDKIKWHSLQHVGPLFPPPYVRLPDQVQMLYNGQPMRLSLAAEEAATWYAKLLGRPVAQNEIFRANFFSQFRMLMGENERSIVQELSLCGFERIAQHLQRQGEDVTSRRQQQQRQQQLEQQHYGYCSIDGRLERIGNYRIEPAGIFLGRGNHPLMGTLKPRIRPEDVTINCSPLAVPAAPAGHHWQAVQHNQSVAWLARWHDTVTSGYKYMLLSSASRLQGIRDLNKFELARRLSNHIQSIRQSYWEDWKSPNLMQRQRGVALYFIDRLMLRVGNDKSENTADTEGCCTLRVEHLQLFEQLQGSAHVVELNFLGKDSIQFRRKLVVGQHVFENLRSFMQHKQPKDLIFDQLAAKKLNQHLSSLMHGLTAKVFRTYNASKLLQSCLDELAPDVTRSLKDKLNAYTIANANAAKFCNHQRAPTKAAKNKLNSFKRAIRAKQLAIDNLRRTRPTTLPVSTANHARRLMQLQNELAMLESQLNAATLRSSLALNTSKMNYLDPRITVAWCSKHGVPIEKIFSAALRTKFDWAISVADASFRF